MSTRLLTQVGTYVDQKETWSSLGGTYFRVDDGKNNNSGIFHKTKGNRLFSILETRLQYQEKFSSFVDLIFMNSRVILSVSSIVHTSIKMRLKDLLAASLTESTNDSDVLKVKHTNCMQLMSQTINNLFW